MEQYLVNVENGWFLLISCISVVVCAISFHWNSIISERSDAFWDSEDCDPVADVLDFVCWMVTIAHLEHLIMTSNADTS